MEGRRKRMAMCQPCDEVGLVVVVTKADGNLEDVLGARRNGRESLVVRGDDVWENDKSIGENLPAHVSDRHRRQSRRLRW